eukprot:COSAG02_NODE_1069_length_14810_cov_6.729998_2_plen_176_part_00
MPSITSRRGRCACLNVSTIHCASFSTRCSPSDGSTFLLRLTWHITACTASIDFIRSNVCQAAYIDSCTNLTQWLDVVLDESWRTVVLRSKSTGYTVARVAVSTMMLHCALSSSTTVHPCGYQPVGSVAPASLDLGGTPSLNSDVDRHMRPCTATPIVRCWPISSITSSGSDFKML